MSRKRSECQPILDRRDSSISLPEHVSACRILPHQRVVSDVETRLKAEGKAYSRALRQRKQGKGIAPADNPLTGTPVERAAREAASRRSLAATTRATRLHKIAAEFGLDSRVTSGLLTEEQAFALASKVYAGRYGA